MYTCNALGTLILSERKCFQRLSAGFLGAAQISELIIRHEDLVIRKTKITKYVVELPCQCRAMADLMAARSGQAFSYSLTCFLLSFVLKHQFR